MQETLNINQNICFIEETQNILKYQNILLKARNKQLQNQNNQLLQQLMGYVQVNNSHQTIQKKFQQLLQLKESIDKVVKKKIYQCFSLINEESFFYSSLKKTADLYNSQGLISFIQKILQQYKKSLKRNFQIQKQNENKQNLKLTDLNRLNSQRLQSLKEKVNKNKLKKQLFVVRLPPKQLDLRKYSNILKDMSQKYKKLFLTLKNPIFTNQDLFKICHYYYQNSLIKLRIENCQLNLTQIQQQWQSGQNSHLCHIKIQQINEKLSQLLKQKLQIKRCLQEEADQLKKKLNQSYTSNQQSIKRKNRKIKV